MLPGMATTCTLDAPTPVLAYSERESCHPDTGEYGILRQEWRAVPFDSSNPRHESVRYSGYFPTVVLECRYIRRGTEEPWEPFDAFEYFPSLLKSLLYGHSLSGEIVAMDPRFAQEQEADRESRAAAELRRDEEARERAEAEAKAERRARGSIAFNKLAQTDAGRSLCDRWDAFVNSATSADIERYKADPEFMRLYTQALEEHRVPSKRRALKDLFKYVGANQ